MYRVFDRGNYAMVHVTTCGHLRKIVSGKVLGNYGTFSEAMRVGLARRDSVQMCRSCCYSPATLELVEELGRIAAEYERVLVGERTNLMRLIARLRRQA